MALLGAQVDHSFLAQYGIAEEDKQKLIEKLMPAPQALSEEEDEDDHEVVAAANKLTRSGTVAGGLGKAAQNARYRRFSSERVA